MSAFDRGEFDRGSQTCAPYAAAGLTGSLWLYALAQGLLIGTGSAATFAPLLAHVSMWFMRRRGIAIAIFASGNYLAGTVWPPIVQHFIQSVGWRQTYFRIAQPGISRTDPDRTTLQLLNTLFGGRFPTIVGVQEKVRVVESKEPPGALVVA